MADKLLYQHLEKEKVATQREHKSTLRHPVVINNNDNMDYLKIKPDHISRIYKHCKLSLTT